MKHSIFLVKRSLSGLAASIIGLSLASVTTVGCSGGGGDTVVQAGGTAGTPGSNGGTPSSGGSGQPTGGSGNGTGGSSSTGGTGNGAGGSKGGGACADSCQWAGDGVCDEPDICAPGTDCADCGPSSGTGGSGAGNSGGSSGSCDTCMWAGDEVCDEPDICPPGTDCSDCGSGPGTGGSGAGGSTGSGSIPAELVGSWYSGSSDAALSYGFAADSSYVYASRYEAATCVTLGGFEMSASGTANAVGNQLTLTPASGTYKTWNCSGTETPEAPDLTPETFTYFIEVVGVDQLLHLVSANNESVLTRQ